MRLLFPSLLIVENFNLFEEEYLPLNSHNSKQNACSQQLFPETQLAKHL